VCFLFALWIIFWLLHISNPTMFSEHTIQRYKSNFGYAFGFPKYSRSWIKLKSVQTRPSNANPFTSKFRKPLNFQKKTYFFFFKKTFSPSLGKEPSRKVISHTKCWKLISNFPLGHNSTSKIQGTEEVTSLQVTLNNFMSLSHHHRIIRSVVRIKPRTTVCFRFICCLPFVFD